MKTTTLILEAIITLATLAGKFLNLKKRKKWRTVDTQAAEAAPKESSM